MRLLLAGANGMLGRDMTVTLAARHELHPFPREALDITDFAQVWSAVAKVRPELVVNCAAYTDVDGCETERETAFRVNALGARNLAVAAHEAGAALLHMSTDYVFDGKGKTPYTEFDPPGPATFYGRSKLAGEEAVRHHCPRHYIVRSAWLYGRHGRNFVHTILRLAAERDRLEVVDDQVGNPTWTREVARAIGELIETGAYGTYHATAEGECSWYDLACEALRLRNVSTLVEPVSTERFPRPAPRPAYSSLDNLGLRALGIAMRPWQEALADFLKEPV